MADYYHHYSAVVCQKIDIPPTNTLQFYDFYLVHQRASYCFLQLFISRVLLRLCRTI